MMVSAIQSVADRLISVPDRTWAAAILVGEARRFSNQNRRARRRDRGDVINSNVDLRGAFAELMFLRELSANAGLSDYDRAAVRTYMLPRLLVSGGSGADAMGPDLQFPDESTGREYGVDVKAHDCAPHKRFFAINAAKHAQLAGQCDAYYCLLCPTFAKTLRSTRLVPYEQVSDWAVMQMKYGDPARVCPLDGFLKSYSSLPSSADLAPLRERANLYDEGVVRALAASPVFRGEMLASIPALRAYLEAGLP